MNLFEEEVEVEDILYRCIDKRGRMMVIRMVQEYAHISFISASTKTRGFFILVPGHRNAFAGALESASEWSSVRMGYQVIQIALEDIRIIDIRNNKVLHRCGIDAEDRQEIATLFTGDTVLSS